MVGHLDLVSGFSGDMCLGCLVDAGWSVDELRRIVSGLGLGADEWSIDARTVMRGAMRATLVDVKAVEGHHHRHLADIRRMIAALGVSDRVKAAAGGVFERLARAEAKVHGTTPDRVHFHEVGAVDAVIDIVGAAAGLEALGVTSLTSSAVPLGDGWTESAHGRIPLPAPATLEILAEVDAPIRPANGPGEWVTPTGAAILAEFATFSQPVMRIARIGTGAGQREAAWPNVARLWLGTVVAGSGYVQIETNIDDMNPQIYAAVAEQLTRAGARDVWLTPVQMKKGRPGVVLSAIAPVSAETAIADVLLRETTTLGVRVHVLTGRHETRHEGREVATPYGMIPVKVKWVADEPVSATPEYEACARAAREFGVTVRHVLDAAGAEAHTLVMEMADVPSQAFPSTGVA